MRRSLVALAVALAAITPHLALGSAGFETGPCQYPAGRPLPGSGAVINVPADQPTIQDGVDVAVEGDTVLIAAGTYHEAVTVDMPGLRIRGESRTGVVLDGQNTLLVALEITADRVVVENLTIHNYRNHGVHWVDVTGYWGRYITAYNMGLYGVFAFGARCGQMDHLYGSGSADSAFYIGQCYPCDAVIHDVVAEENGLGYSGTNAGGNLVIRDSIWRNNAIGIAPNSLDSEDRPPQRGLTIKNNIVDANNAINAPGTGIQAQFYGIGIVVAGGQSNSIYGNAVTDNAVVGVVLVPLPSDNVWIPSGNTTWGNTVTHDASAYPDSIDLAQGLISGPDNCWADNVFSTSAPPEIETIWSCGITQTPPGGDPRIELGLIQGVAGLNGRMASPWETWPAPTCGAHPSACLAQPDDNGNASYADDGAVDAWIPALGL